MKVMNLVQGTPEWHAYRASHFNASDAPAMMGVSKYTTRTQLIHRLATGETEEITPAKQALFDRGHAAEAAVRPKIEAMLLEDLYPIIGECDEHPKLSASYDGLTLDESTGIEVKLWNEELVAQVRAGEITDPHYWVQLEQHYIVNEKLRRLIFVVTREDASEYETVEYVPVPGRRESIIAGWAQLEDEIKNYVPQEVKAAKVGRAPDSLLALRVEVTGMVTASNLAEFRDHAIAVFDNINRELVDDQDFADAEKTIKWCADIEARLKATKEAVLAQTADIEEVFRTMDDITAKSTAVRLELNKLVEAEKKNRRLAIQRGAEMAFTEHMQSLNARLGRVQMPAVPADFAAQIKGKRSIASMEDAVNTELARLKIQSNAIADGIQANLNKLDELAANHAFLFADLQQIAMKAADDFEMLVKSRISEHQAKEEARLQADRERIERETRERIEREQKEAEERRRQSEAEAAAQEQHDRDLEDAAAEQGFGLVLTNTKTGEVQLTSGGVADVTIVAKPKRPTDDQMITLISREFGVPFSVAAGWILTMDLAAIANMAKEA